LLRNHARALRFVPNAQGHVGNDAIAAALENKLANHLQIQLPGLYKQLKARKAALDKELSTIPNPSWSHIEKVFLSYGRMVQAQANNDGMSQGTAIASFCKLLHTVFARF
jgi:hypothetical protein